MNNIIQKTFLVMLLMIGFFIFPIDFFILGFFLGTKYFSKPRKHKINNMGMFDKALLSILLIFLSISILPFGFFVMGWMFSFKQYKKEREITIVEH